MSNPSTAAANGRPQRKTLADQLDRLDGIIDDLSVGLNEAVAHVVQQAVAQAVEQAIGAALRAVLARPELLRQLAPEAPAPDPDWPPAHERPTLWARAKGAARRCRQAAASGLGRAASAVSGGAPRAYAALLLLAALARQSPRPVAAAAAVGVAVGVGTLLAGPAVAALVSGLAGAALALAAAVLRPFWGLLAPAMTPGEAEAARA